MGHTAREVEVGSALLEQLTDALAQARQGATTKPVSVTLPAPLADAFRLLADRGVIDSVSEATTHALEEALQAVIVGMRLDKIYTEASAVDAVVAEAAVRTRAQFLVTSDPGDGAALLDRAAATPHVVTV